MSEVQRYSIERYKEVSVEVVSEEDGDFVSYTDYIQLEHHKRELIILVSALEQQKAELTEKIKGLFSRSGNDKYDDGYDKAISDVLDIFRKQEERDER